MSQDVRISDAWERDRSYLVNLAFRMLGDIGEAEDVVQEAFVRLVKADAGAIEDARGWLIVVTSRLCLDVIRSARRQRQRPHDLDAVESTLAGVGPSFADPADRVTLDESVRLALLVVLERLTPAERVVFVLHDVFQLPYDSIAESVGKSAQACRQLARRAHLKIEREHGAAILEVATAEQRLVTDRFIAACASGDLQGLLDVLAPGVSGEVDLIPDVVTTGAERVAANLLRFWGPPARLVSYPAGRHTSLLAFVDRRLAGVITLNLAEDRIAKIHVIADRDRLDRWDFRLPNR